MTTSNGKHADDEETLALRTKAQLLADQGKIAEALALLTAAIEAQTELNQSELEFLTTFIIQARQKALTIARAKAAEAAQNGRFAEAFAILSQAVSQESAPARQDLEFCAVYAWNMGDFPKALVFLEQVRKMESASLTVLNNLGACYNKLGRFDDTVTICREIEARGDADSRTYDNMVYAMSEQRNLGEAIRYGSLALEALAAAALNSPKPDLPPRKAFNPLAKDRNIISFALWGNNPRYLRGAVRNTILAHDIYPSWRCRFYIDETVPTELRILLAELEAQIFMLPRAQSAFEGLGWRFLVWNDPNVDFCIVRDCDSVISAFEATAVNQWLESDKWYHIMRCWYSHTDLIMAGMWGGATGMLRNVYPRYVQNASQYLTSVADQQFLGRYIWPEVHHHALIHDRFHRLPNTLPFPGAELFAGNWHVGINEAVRPHIAKQNLLLKAYETRCPCLKLPVTKTFHTRVETVMG